MKKDQLIVASKKFDSRLIVGTGKYKTMSECQANLLSQHPDKSYQVMREFVEDNNFKWDWLVAGCTNEETGEKYMVFPEYPKGKPPELEGLEFELKDLLI